MRAFVRPLIVLLLAGGAAVGVGTAPATAVLPGFTCGVAAGGSTAVHSHVTDVRVGQHLRFDRFVIQFDTATMPHYRITPKANATFTLDPSGRSVTLLGKAGIRVAVHFATGDGTYHGPADFRTGFPQLLEARRLGDFEGYVSWGLGLDHQSCKRVLTLSNPTRLVIDVPH
jgi:hypothetical protein